MLFRRAIYPGMTKKCQLLTGMSGSINWGMIHLCVVLLHLAISGPAAGAMISTKQLMIQADVFVIKAYAADC